MRIYRDFNVCCCGSDLDLRPRVVDCVACLGFVTITTLAGKAIMASASEISLLPTLPKRLQAEETVRIMCCSARSAPNLRRLMLLRTRRWREIGFGGQIFDDRSARGFGPPHPPLPPDARDEQLVVLMADEPCYYHYHCHYHSDHIRLNQSSALRNNLIKLIRSGKTWKELQDPVS